MARIKRIVIPNTPHHVTQLFTQCKIHELKIVSYCLMTNHVHIIAIPKNKESLSKVIGETHRLYTRKINFEQKVKGHLFQERFYSTPLDDTHFLYALRYVEQNPVKAYMVKYPWDYKYSSTKYRLGSVKEDKVLSKYEAIDNISNYKEFIQKKTQIKLIKEKTRTGKPCGDDSFYDKIKLLTGIDYKNKKPGPKEKSDD